jgi:hypothetical protein
MNTFPEILLYCLLSVLLFFISYVLYTKCKNNQKYVTLENNTNAISYLQENQDEYIM